MEKIIQHNDGLLREVRVLRNEVNELREKCGELKGKYELREKYGELKGKSASIDCLQHELTISFTNSLDQRFLEVDRNIAQRFAKVDRNIAQRFAEADKNIAQRFAEVDTRFTEVNTNINSLRSDLVAIMKNMQVSIKHIYDVTHLNLATNCENGVYEINTSFK